MASVDWQFTHTDFHDRHGYMLKNALWTDCKLRVGLGPEQEVIEAHKDHLLSASPVFEKLFYGENQNPDVDQESRTIDLPKHKPKIIREMLSFIYLDKMELTSFTEVVQLYYVSQDFKIPQLKNKCIKYMESQLTCKRNIDRVLNFAASHKEKLLKNMCLKFVKIISNTKQYLKSKSFEKDKLSTVIQIYKMEEMNCTELDLFEALERYAKAYDRRLLLRSMAYAYTNRRPWQPSDEVIFNPALFLDVGMTQDGIFWANTTAKIHVTQYDVHRVTDRLLVKRFHLEPFLSPQKKELSDDSCDSFCDVEGDDEGDDEPTAETYTSTNPETTKDDSIRTALKQIRFLTFTVREFTNPARSKLFTDSEASALFMNIMKRPHVPMPEGFSTRTDYRIYYNGRC